MPAGLEKDRLLPVERGVLNCLRKKIYSVVERDILTFRKNEVSSFRNDLRYGLHVNTRISANKSKSEMLKDED